MRMIAVLAIAVAVSATGCSQSKVGGDQWIIASPGDTLTVSDAAAVWSSLNPEERAFFTSSDDPAGAFVEALAGKAALERLVTDSGLLRDPELLAMTECWLRVESAMAARNLIAEEETASVNEADIEFWRRNQGVAVWFSADSACPVGPFAIAELPRALATTLDRLAPGEAASLEGFGVVRLDSLVRNPVQAVEQPDSLVALIIGGERERFGYLREYTRLIEEGGTGISQGFMNLSELPEDSVVIHSPLGRWTRSQIETEIAFLKTRFPQVEASAQWAGMMLENLVMQSHFRNVLESDHPQVADSIREASLAYLQGQAAETLLKQYLDSAVTVSREDLEEEYSLLPESPVSPERRIFSIAAAGIEELPELRLAVAAGGDIEGYPGVEGLAVQGSDPGVSRPLVRADMPGDAASVLFGTASDDTLTWFGPFEVSQGVFAAFRLREVLPSRPATIEEMEPQLVESARRRLEAGATEVYLNELQVRMQIIVNEDVIDRLPPDPGQWESSGDRT